MTPNCTGPADWCNFGAYEKLLRACFFQIALETILLPILIAYITHSDRMKLVKHLQPTLVLEHSVHLEYPLSQPERTEELK